MPGIKIKLGTENQREIMDLLHSFASHREICESCDRAMNDGKPDGYCKTGQTILYDLSRFQEVQPA